MACSVITEQNAYVINNRRVEVGASEIPSCSRSEIEKLKNLFSEFSPKFNQVSTPSISWYTRDPSVIRAELNQLLDEAKNSSAKDVLKGVLKTIVSASAFGLLVFGLGPLLSSGPPGYFFIGFYLHLIVSLVIWFELLGKDRYDDSGCGGAIFALTGGSVWVSLYQTLEAATRVLRAEMRLKRAEADISASPANIKKDKQRCIAEGYKFYKEHVRVLLPQLHQKTQQARETLDAMRTNPSNALYRRAIQDLETTIREGQRLECLLIDFDNFYRRFNDPDDQQPAITIPDLLVW